MPHDSLITKLYVNWIDEKLLALEVVACRSSVKKVFLEISQNSGKHLCKSLFIVSHSFMATSVTFTLLSEKEETRGLH